VFTIESESSGINWNTMWCTRSISLVWRCKLASG